VILLDAHRWIWVLLAAAVLLPPLPLPGGDSGPHPAALVAVAGLAAGVARLRHWRFRLDPLSASIILFLGALLISVPLAALYSGPAIALGTLVRVALFGISVYVYFYLTAGPGRDVAGDRMVRLLFWAGLASAAFACLDFYFQFPAPARFAEQYVWLPQGVFRRAQGVFYEASTLGSFCNFLLVLVASIAALRLGPGLGLSPWTLGFAAMVLLTGLMFSFSRAAVVSLGVALAALTWLQAGRAGPGGPARPRGAAPHLLAMAAVVGAVLAFAVAPAFLSHYGQRLWSSVAFLAEAPNLVFSRRLETWQFAFDWIAQHPWQTLWGVGYKTLPYTSQLGRPLVVDNMYLSLLLETGWLGLTALVALNATILVHTYKLAVQGRLCGVWMFCFWCGQTVQMLSGDILTYWRLLPAFFAVLAIGSRDEDPVSGPVL
jgi:hypothetical protein